MRRIRVSFLNCLGCRQFVTIIDGLSVWKQNPELQEEESDDWDLCRRRANLPEKAQAENASRKLRFGCWTVSTSLRKTFSIRKNHKIGPETWARLNSCSIPFTGFSTYRTIAAIWRSSATLPATEAPTDLSAWCSRVTKRWENELIYLNYLPNWFNF